MPYCDKAGSCVCHHIYCCDPLSGSGRQVRHCHIHGNGCHIGCRKPMGRPPNKKKRR